jgi:hypothetical protein
MIRTLMTILADLKKIKITIYKIKSTNSIVHVFTFSMMAGLYCQDSSLVKRYIPTIQICYSSGDYQDNLPLGSSTIL